MSDLSDLFNAMASSTTQYEDSKMVKTSIRVPAKTLRVIQYLADNLGRSRNNLIATILEEGSFEALRGYCVGAGMTDSEWEQTFNSLQYGPEDEEQNQ